MREGASFLNDFGKILFSVIGVTALILHTLHAKRQTSLECLTQITVCTNFDIYVKNFPS